MAEEARCALVASTVSLSVWERDRGLLRTLINAGELGPQETELPDDETYALCEDPLTERLALDATGYVQTLGDAGGNTQIHRLLSEHRKNSCLAVPVLCQGRVWGELWATRASGLTPYSTDDLDFAAMVAAQVGAGIAQVEHSARVQHLAYSDDLTGLANRRAFEEALDRALTSSSPRLPTVGVILLDVNGLKRINDRLGHVAGDSALITLAGELSAAVSALPNTLAARLGGDEFCLLTAGAGTDEVVALAEDVCRRGAEVLAEGVSCGVATTDWLPMARPTSARILQSADAAQYRAKRTSAPGPVVAGSQQPDADTTPLPGERIAARRGSRGRNTQDQGQLVDALVRHLDAGSDHDPLLRLSLVANAMAEALDAASWWLSSFSPGADDIVARGSHIERRPEDLAADDYYQPVSYRFDGYPATAAAFAGHCILVDADDPRSDPAEVSLLQCAGMHEMMMCGGTDAADTRWLVEILGDDLTVPMRAYTSVLRAGVALALRR